MFKNKSIFVKQGILAGIILVFLIATGVIGFNGFSRIGDRLKSIYSATVQADASKEMGNAVFQDFIAAMNLIYADTVKKVDAAWEGHRGHVKKFDEEVERLLDSLEASEQTDVDTSLQKMKQMVEQAVMYHKKELQPEFKEVFDEVSREIGLREDLYNSMKQIEAVYNELIELSENFESTIKDRIKVRIRQGASAASILGRENTWADMAMELKSTLAGSRIAVEEYAQSMEARALPETEKEYLAMEKEFDVWINALLNGADTDEGKIAAVRVDAFRKIVLEIQDKNRNSYRVEVANFMKLQQALIRTGQEKMKTVARAEATSKKLAGLLLEIETLAAGNMKRAEDEAVSAAINADILMGVAILASIVISIIFIVIISRGITGPLKKAVDFAETMSSGDFSKSLDIDQADEVGKLAVSLNKMVANLSRMIRKTHGGVSTLTATSSELSSLSEVMATGAESTAEKSNTVASASEEMNSNVESVAAAMEQATTNVNNVAAAVEEMNASFNEITAQIGQTLGNTQQAAQVSADSSQVVGELGNAAQEIETILDTINTIADKTSLLALNATIEAARAGDAGKGFAVVAGEIKGLAQQVSDSTGDIGSKLKAIQDATQSTVSGINEIEQVISEVNESVETINTSMEQQNLATQEISENISQTSAGLREVNENVSQTSLAVAQVNQEIADVNRSANEINTSSNDVQANADNLMDLSRQLSTQVAEFKTEEAGFSAGPAKMAHSAWKKKLADLLAGKSDLQVSDVSSHQECEFGKWYFGQGMDSFGENATFKQIDKGHRQVHEMAKEITSLYHAGEVDKAMSRYQKFTQVTNGLFKLLDQLEDEV